MAGTGDRAVLDGSDQDHSEITNRYIAKLYFSQATGLLTRCSFAESEVYFREVLRLWPNHPGALNNLGTAVWQQGRVRAISTAGHCRWIDDFAVLNNRYAVGAGRPTNSWFYRRALRLQADSPETDDLGVALSDLRNLTRR
jgi:hypothetical protein